MPKVTRICRVCGKQYVACATPGLGVFRYTDVACSKECGQEYLRQILEARGELPPREPDVVESPRTAQDIDTFELSAEEAEAKAEPISGEDFAAKVQNDAEAEEADERKEAEEVPVPRWKRHRRKG